MIGICEGEASYMERYQIQASSKLFTLSQHRPIYLKPCGEMGYIHEKEN